MFVIPQSTSFVAVFKAYLSTDHVTEATGKTIAITISKAGGAFANPSAGATNATEISSGWYSVTLSTTDTGTLGALALRGAVATIDDVGMIFMVSPVATVAAVGSAVWQDATAGDFTVASSIGKALYIANVAPGAAGGHFIAGTNAATSITTALTANITGNVSGSVGSVTGAVGSVGSGGITTATFASGAINAAAIATDAIGAAELAADAVAEIADQVWDEVASGHVATGTFGERLISLRANTAQAGAAGSITLDAGASSVTDFYVNALVVVTSGTGAIQARTITAYDGTTKIATITPNWGTNPAAASTFVIIPAGFVSGAAAPTTAQIATAVWQDATAGDFTTASSIGKALYVANVVPGASGGHFIAGTNAATSITTALTANVTGNITGNLSGSVGSVTGNITGSVGSLATQTKADVNAEVLDVLNVDTYVEPGQGTPAATLSLAAKVNYLFKAWRNKKTQTATVHNLFNAGGATVDQKSTVSDDGTTATRGEVATGP